MLSRDTIRDHNVWNWIARIAAIATIVAVAWVFIAPDVDLADSTCDQPTLMKILLQAPVVAVPAAGTIAATRFREVSDVFARTTARTHSEILLLSCAWIC